MTDRPGADRERALLVETFWRHYRDSGSESRAVREASDELFWAWEAASAIAQDPPDDVVDLFVALAESAPNDQARCYLGTGPMEDLVLHHGPRFLDQIEMAARRSEAFRVALRCVSLSSYIDPVVVERLRRFRQAP